MRRVWAAKVAGTQALLAALHDRDRPLVLFGSVSATFGAAGQTAYAAASALLEGWAMAERRAGRPTTCVAWGPWAQIGMAARLSDAQRLRIERAGLVALDPRVASGALGDAVAGPPVVVVAQRIAPSARPEASPGVVHRLREQSAPERRKAVRERVEAEAADLLGRTPDPQTPLWDQGMDSLGIIELRNRLAVAGLTIPLPDIMSGPSIDAVVDRLVADLTAAETSEDVRPDADAPDAPLAPLSPWASHLAAAAAGALVVGMLALALWQVLTADTAPTDHLDVPRPEAPADIPR